MPVPSTKWSATRDTMTFATGSTLTVDAGATFSCAGYVASTVTTLRVTTTSELNGNVSMGPHGAATLVVAGTTGIVTLANSMTIDPTETDVTRIGKFGFCNDTSPAATPAANLYTLYVSANTEGDLYLLSSTGKKAKVTMGAYA